MQVFKYFIFSSVLLLFSCQEKVDQSDLHHLNGYWEIEKAEMPDGEVKEYTVNMSIDFFELKDDTGFRQKVVPQFDGGYLTNDVREDIKVVFEGKKAWLDYHTEFADWKEELIVVKPNRLVVKNEHDIKYYYKRPIAFSKK
ncbi:hypothetical protein [Myroides guanonis]|uniref:Lipocalin-like domain-containing protein n=1 Tax=Myroides guanonis TaxID=1150112 RepID=A0A1I3NL41_9FLAO|nr:hypothetical protein [Myroides guanonis]SFJ09877.1 hypothetical protein SAMN04487893_103117 [Myroides guanonis]